MKTPSRTRTVGSFFFLAAGAGGARASASGRLASQAGSRGSASPLFSIFDFFTFCFWKKKHTRKPLKVEKRPFHTAKNKRLSRGRRARAGDRWSSVRHEKQQHEARQILSIHTPSPSARASSSCCVVCERLVHLTNLLHLHHLHLHLHLSHHHTHTHDGVSARGGVSAPGRVAAFFHQPKRRTTSPPSRQPPLVVVDYDDDDDDDSRAGCR